MSDGVTAGGDASVAVPSAEYLEERYRVSELEVVRSDTHGVAECCPQDPVRICCFGTPKNYSGADRFLDNAKVTAESISGLGW